MKICAIIITYFPNIELLKTNISRFYNYIDELIIWDNTPDNNPNLLTTALKEYHVSILTQHENVGISKAMNVILSKIQEDNFTHILTMDQDSLWNNFENFKNYVLKQNNLAVYGPFINNEVKYNMDTSYLITSGMLIPLKILKKIKGYNEYFFLDGIDIELCNRIKANGYDIIKTQAGTLIQRFGANSKKIFLNRNFTILDYSPSRRYENMKALTIIGRGYKKNINYWFSLLFYSFFLAIIKILFFEKDKIKKSYALIKGLISGVKIRPKEINRIINIS